MADRTLPEVMELFRDRLFAGFHVALPARVERYDGSKMQCDAKPLIKFPRIIEGELVLDDLPVISNVPIVFPGGGGLRITFPIEAGDTVLLVFADRSLDVWLDQGGNVDPRDQRSHHLSDAIAIPGLNPFNAAWGGHEEGVITIGSDNGASQKVAIAQKVLDQLNSIANTFNSHTHQVTTAGAPTAHQGTAAPPTSSITGLQEPGSETVKIRG